MKDRREKVGMEWGSLQTTVSFSHRRKKTSEKASGCSTVLRDLPPGLWSIAKPELPRRGLLCRAGMGQHYPCRAVGGWGQPSSGGELDLGTKAVGTKGAVSRTGFPQLVVLKEI